MTYNEFRTEAQRLLCECSDVENPDFEISTIICHICSIGRARLLAVRGEQIAEKHLPLLREAVERRVQHEPLQYIIGEWEFFGLRMFCGSGCLIPRPETELLVEKAIELIPKNGHFLDLCTGSGCISVAILNNRKDVTGTAVDISADALGYARRNAEYHKVEKRLELVNMPLEEYLPIKIPDCIISNPPYVKTADVDAFPPVMKYEPRIAFDGGHDGLEFYKTIAKRYTARFLKDGGYLLFEAGYDTVREVEAILKYRKMETGVLEDMFGVERVCIGRKMLAD